jgi:hypothetical protein
MINAKFSWAAIRHFFLKKRGSATGISLGFSTGVLAVSLGTVAIVSNTVEENKNVEDSSVAYFAAERGLEYSLFDLSGHLGGYEVQKDSIEGRLKTSEREAKTVIEIQSRSTKDEEAAEQTITVPVKGGGSSPHDDNWNTLEKGKSSTIPLYIDNTSN